MARITFDDKEDRLEQPYQRKNLVIGADVNEIKASVNALYDLMGQIKKPIVYSITSTDFTGPYFTKTDTVGLTPMVDFQLYSNEGSGVLLSEGTGKGYSFNAALGRITTDSGNYILIIFKPLS